METMYDWKHFGKNRRCKSILRALIVCVMQPIHRRSIDAFLVSFGVGAAPASLIRAVLVFGAARPRFALTTCAHVRAFPCSKHASLVSLCPPVAYEFRLVLKGYDRSARLGVSLSTVALKFRDPAWTSFRKVCIVGYSTV